MDVLCKVYNLYPCGEEIATVRQFFWAAVILSWVLTFVPQSSGGGGVRRRNYSIVDRVWPLFPLMLVVQWMYHQHSVAQQFSSKALVAASLVTAWSLRLTYNSIRRGDYALGAEDYRWAYVRKWFDRVLGTHGVLRTVVWEIYNFGFISLFQLGLLYQISVPVRKVITATTVGDSEDTWSLSQVALAVLMSLLLVAEAIADQQQYEFQRLKRPGALESAEIDRDYAQSRSAEVKAGFVYSGLWRFTRHPNLFCEQVFWTTMALFAEAAAGKCECRLLVGPALLIALMWGSVELTESISLAKYPLYRAYQLKTSRLVPCRPRTNTQVVVNHVISGIRLAYVGSEPASAYGNRLLRPLMRVCSNFRAVACSLYHHRFYLNFQSTATRKNIMRYLRTGRLEFDRESGTYLGHPTHGLARELVIGLKEKAIYSGELLRVLSLAAHEDRVFPMVRKLTLMLLDKRRAYYYEGTSESDNDSDGDAVDPATVETNVSAFLEQLKHMVPLVSDIGVQRHAIGNACNIDSRYFFGFISRFFRPASRISFNGICGLSVPMGPHLDELSNLVHINYDGHIFDGYDWS
ncbi:hypothetical protein GGF42_005109 [Coemansia sp. RSA 2424]|nr:hypothetical protein GGF42_005109 [Coemansia sp. RSA 2424]